MRGCYRCVDTVQENLAKPPGPNGLPKMVSPAKMKTYQECKTRKEKLEADMQSGALTAEAYAKTLVRANFL